MTKNKLLHKCSREIWSYYDTHGRHNLPWRTHPTPYRVLVSEIMLQQTQVARVEEYFKRWMQHYPSWRSLSKASRKEVLLDWQGLGYNRRGVYLHEIAKIVTDEYYGTLPRGYDELVALPGIGDYTAGAIQAFAFDTQVLFLETNIRTVLIHHFTGQTCLVKKVDEKTLRRDLGDLIAQDSRAQQHPREFYYALMDYGAYLKKNVGNLNKQAKSYTKQSRFEGSRRQVRAGILRYILHNGPVARSKIITQSNKEPALIDELLQEMLQERTIVKSAKKYMVDDTKSGG